MGKYLFLQTFKGFWNLIERKLINDKIRWWNCRYYRIISRSKRYIEKYDNKY